MRRSWKLAYLALLCLGACRAGSGRAPDGGGPLGDAATGGDGGGPGGPGLVAYWGQNGVGGAGAPAAQYEKDLATTCAEARYDIVVLGFLTRFVSPRNQDGYPALDFANHCSTPYDARNPALLRCSEIAGGIAACQARGARVLLSLGGASGDVGFAGDGDAEVFAQTTWDLFLGGSGSVRPFAPATLDGIDLDVESGGAGGYAAYVKQLRALAAADGRRRYLITAAPQCPYPDAILGPRPGSALGDAAGAFDYLFVQFYNNGCSYTQPAAFDDSFRRWAALAAAGGPRVVVGLPAASNAAPAGGYVARDRLPGLVASVRGRGAFGGVMLWDASFDQNSVSGGQTYGAYVRSLLAP